MTTVAAIFAPPVIALFAGLSLGLGTILFFVYRRGAIAVINLRVPLSWSEPIEVRLILYFLFGAVFGTGALFFRLMSMLPGEGSAGAWLLLIIALLLLFVNLTFFYAALGSLLQAALGTNSRPPFWFSRYLSWFDNLVMDFGDLIASVLIHPAGAPGATGGRSVRKRPEMAFEPEPAPEQQAPVPEMPPAPSLTRAQQAAELARQRMEQILQQYEQALTPLQREKYDLMHAIVESIKRSYDD